MGWTSWGICFASLAGRVNWKEQAFGVDSREIVTGSYLHSYQVKIRLTKALFMLYSRCRGQNSAPCRVIVWLRPAQFYIPGESFSKAANVSGFFCV